VVFGGGGVAGVAWGLGIVHGLCSRGVDLRTATLSVGTSAGATIGAVLTTGLTPEEAYRRQVDPVLQNAEQLPGGLPVEQLFELMIGLAEEYPDPAERRRKLCQVALETETSSEQVRRRILEGRLPVHRWPEAGLAVTAVETSTGDRVVFGPESGVDLVDAVAASSAVPGMWPPVTIGGRRFVDGGVYSSTNADLAEGFDRVVIVAPMPTPDTWREVEALRATSRVDVVRPDENSLAAIGANPLDPSVREPCARAGERQGLAEAERIAAVWDD
jgi:NTE family protein